MSVETFGPEYVRPARKECEHCECCTEALCARGATTILECLGCTAAPETRATVAGCPCSSEETPGTAAWRAGRLRVTQLALDEERRLPDDQVEVLRLVADLGDPVESQEQVFALAARRFVGMVGSHPELTELGAVYLRALEEERVESAASVVAVDSTTRTAEVMVYAIGPELVTVLLDQLLVATELTAEELVGRPLAVMTNLPGSVEDVVLTGIRLLPPPVVAEKGTGRVDDALSPVPASEAPTAVLPVVEVLGGIPAAVIPVAVVPPAGDGQALTETAAVMPLAEAPQAAIGEEGGR
ncbi:hypothetical protein [Streptomyces sp. NRRL S-350]|uniref:hypothetical protein n=1 Tax=Streptomyces sp. NRRL S-350 TaxID=1463902 RepID=UPI0004C2A606|nr:hypothetical protein [Streptomyces sp. NRRL S-350]